MQDSATARWIASSEVGFVSGRVDRPITDEERQRGAIGHTKEQWIAYNKLAGQYPLKDNHGKVVGRIVQTYIDDEHNLCASALLDRDQAELWEAVRDGKVHSFSIGYDAIREQPGEPYKNKDFEVSLTQTPRKPHARITVRCSMTEPTPTAPSTPAPAETPAPTAMDVDILRELQAAREDAAKWQARQAAKEQKRMEERMRALQTAVPMLAANGMNVDDPGQHQLLEVLARTQGSEQFLSAMSNTAAQLQQMKEENARLAALAAEREKDAQQLAHLRRQVTGVAPPTTGDAKRPTLTPASWNATPAAEMTPAQALALNLNSIDKNLFSSAARTVASSAAPGTSLFDAAAAAAERGASAPNPQPSPDDVAREQFDGRVEMPKTPEEQLRMTAHYVAMNKPPLQVEVRCSEGSETAGQIVFDEYLRKHPSCFANTIPKLRGGLTPNEAELFFRNDSYWQQFANETSSMIIRAKDNAYGELAAANDCLGLVRPGWDNSADLRAFLASN